MGLKNLAAISAALRGGGRPADTPAAVVQDGTTAGQRVIRGTLGSIAADAVAAEVRPPAVVVIGGVVAVAGPAAVAGVALESLE
jgi:uroporphyrin-III C-methyltransferase/precorrin-2 dehydrogenase/sirohydrochlorin ferrochelatase